MLESREWVSFFDPSVFDNPDTRFARLEELYWEIGQRIFASKKLARDVFIDCQSSRKYQKKFQTEYYQIRLLKHTPLHTDSIFFEDRFFLVSYDDEIQLLEVQNIAMAQLQLTMFERLWKSLE